MLVVGKCSIKLISHLLLQLKHFLVYYLCQLIFVEHNHITKHVSTLHNTTMGQAQPAIVYTLDFATAIHKKNFLKISDKTGFQSDICDKCAEKDANVCTILHIMRLMLKVYANNV